MMWLRRNLPAGTKPCAPTCRASGCCIASAALVALPGQPPKCMPGSLSHNCSCSLVLNFYDTLYHCLPGHRLVQRAAALVALLMQAPKFASQHSLSHPSVHPKLIVCVNLCDHQPSAWCSMHPRWWRCWGRHLSARLELPSPLIMHSVSLAIHAMAGQALTAALSRAGGAAGTATQMLALRSQSALLYALLFYCVLRWHGTLVTTRWD